MYQGVYLRGVPALNVPPKRGTGNTDAGGSAGHPFSRVQSLQPAATLRGENLKCLLPSIAAEEGKLACAPRDVPSNEDGAVGGGEQLIDGQIRFSGPLRSNEVGEAFLFLIRVPGATRNRAAAGGLFRRFKFTRLRGR